MAILLSDLLNMSMPQGRTVVENVTGPQVVGDTNSNSLMMSLDLLPVTWLFDNLAKFGVTVRIVQGDDGLITFAPKAGAFVDNALGFHTSGGKNTEIVATVVGNPDNISARWLLTGMMQSP